ncbi:MAG TPA: acetylxylan esterase [Phytomonospora sp.]
MWFDLSPEKLRDYRPEREEPGDFDRFWLDTLAEARTHELAAVFEPFDSLLATVDVFDATFAGYAGDPVRGWFIVPRGLPDEPLPCVVSYIGYGGGRGKPHEHLFWSAAGYANFVMDTRGQGGRGYGGGGATPDPDPVGASANDGYMTRGIESPDTYYYRRVFTDAARAIEAARSHPRVDAARIVLAGGSQGGGITLAAAGLVPDVAAALPDVPFLCHFRRATTLVDEAPYNQIGNFLRSRRDLVDTAYRTLSYFDGMNFAARATAPALFSTALSDKVCPPSTVFAAYNHYAGPKDIKVWHFNGHEGGGPYQAEAQLEFLAKSGLR